jgi:hypothetical protein
MEHDPSSRRPAHPTVRALILMAGLLLVIVARADASATS